MTDTDKILLMDGQPHRLVEEDTTLREVEDHYEDRMGEARVRQHDFSLIEIPPHDNL